MSKQGLSVRCLAALALACAISLAAEPLLEEREAEAIERMMDSSELHVRRKAALLLYLNYGELSPSIRAKLAADPLSYLPVLRIARPVAPLILIEALEGPTRAGALMAAKILSVQLRPKRHRPGGQDEHEAIALALETDSIDEQRSKNAIPLLSALLSRSSFNLAPYALIPKMRPTVLGVAKARLQRFIDGHEEPSTHYGPESVAGDVLTLALVARESGLAETDFGVLQQIEAKWKERRESALVSSVFLAEWARERSWTSTKYLLERLSVTPNGADPLVYWETGPVIAGLVLSPNDYVLAQSVLSSGEVSDVALCCGIRIMARCCCFDLDTETLLAACLSHESALVRGMAAVEMVNCLDFSGALRRTAIRQLAREKDDDTRRSLEKSIAEMESLPFVNATAKHVGDQRPAPPPDQKPPPPAPTDP